MDLGGSSLRKIIISILLGFLIILPSCADRPFEPAELVHPDEPVKVIRTHLTRPGQMTAVSTQPNPDIYRYARPLRQNSFQATSYQQARQDQQGFANLDILQDHIMNIPIGRAMIDTLPQQDGETIYIEDVSIQEHRVENGDLIATLRLFVNDISAEIDLIGTLLEDGTADMEQVGGVPLVYGVVICIDQEFCRHIVLDIYHRNNYGGLQRYQVESFNSSDEDEPISEDEIKNIENKDRQTPSQPSEQTSRQPPSQGQQQLPKTQNTEQQQQPPLEAQPLTQAPVQPSQVGQNTDNEDIVRPPEEPHFEESDSLSSDFPNRPPNDIDAINLLPVPTEQLLQEQQQQTARIRERVGEGESWQDVASSPEPSSPQIKGPTTHPEPQKEDPVIENVENPEDLETSQNPNVTTVLEENPEVVITTEEEFVGADPDIEIELARGVVSSDLTKMYERGVNQDVMKTDQAVWQRSSLRRVINGRQRYVHGILQEGEPLLNNPSQYGVRWRDNDSFNIERRWVTTLMNLFLKVVGPNFRKKYPQSYLTVNRTANREGGILFGRDILPSGRRFSHKTHQNGLDLDIAYPHANPETRFWSVYRGAEFIMTEQDAQMTLDLLSIMSATGVVNKYHVDQQVKNYLIEIARRNGTLEQYRPVLRQLCPISGHHDHIHVQLICTRFNPRCQNSANPPYNSCPENF